MDEGESKTCENCKREIPAVNFTIHTVHCARNIRVCPVCKEPIPQAELQEHHEKLHKLLPCKECGESVCGTDLEDHVRDSCAHTMKTCRFCALELRRGSMPAHERYCGARTEQCADCGEWVMHKYRQLHLDSNHGFIRLDDDPVPIKKDVKTTNVPKPSNLPSVYIDQIKPKDPINGITENSRNGENIRNFLSTSSNVSKNMPSTSKIIPITSRSQLNGPSMSGSTNSSRSNSTIAQSINRAVPSLSNINKSSNLNSKVNDVLGGTSSAQNGAIPRTKRTNDQPQVNTAMAPVDKVQKDLWASRGAVKKRPAPKPPTKGPADPKRDLPLQSALERQQDEERMRQEQTAYNLSVGLPPVLSPAAKLEKLRKMDALQNPVVDDQDYKNRLQGRVWMSPDITPVGHVLGSSNTPNTSQNFEVSRRKSKSKSPDLDRRNDLKNLKPMTPEEFMDRFNKIHLRKEPEELVKADRFSQIKSSLRELRRGLNEVTAPYNSNANNDVSQISNRTQRSPADEGDVSLPCEFCDTLVPVDDLVQHQTGCRPDLAQYKPRRRHQKPTPTPTPTPNPTPTPITPRDSHSDPVIFIPCEFCTEPQPVYLLSDHQERCGRDANLLFPD
ncbi:unnamed protein product, partial [Brenthis ino]